MPGYRSMFTDEEVSVVLTGIVSVFVVAFLIVVVTTVASIKANIDAPKCPTCSAPYVPGKQPLVSQREERYRDALEEIVQENYTAEETRVFIKAVLEEWNK